jgi:sirohydrochlorin ferrochelatase
VKRAILIVDHGSRRREANALLERVVELVAKRAPEAIVRCAHMDLAEPSMGSFHMRNLFFTICRKRLNDDQFSA